MLEDDKLLLYYEKKTGNYFVISLDFGYVLHHCNVKKLLIYPHDINECGKT